MPAMSSNGFNPVCEDEEETPKESEIRVEDEEEKVADPPITKNASGQVSF